MPKQKSSSNFKAKFKKPKDNPAKCEAEIQLEAKKAGQTILPTKWVEFQGDEKCNITPEVNTEANKFLAEKLQDPVGYEKIKIKHIHTKKTKDGCGSCNSDAKKMEIKEIELPIFSDEEPNKIIEFRKFKVLKDTQLSIFKQFTLKDLEASRKWVETNPNAEIKSLYSPLVQDLLIRKLGL